MPNLFYISESDALVEKKVNFFHDWFQFYANKIGKLHEFELENPLSLIDKIIYQIENNPDKYLPYIEKYFESTYFDNDAFLQNFNNYTKFISLLVIFKNEKGAKKKTSWISNNPQFLSQLKNLSQDLQKNLFRKSLDLLIDYILSKNDIKEDKNEIKYHTKIIVSEYFFNGNSYKEIHKLFSKILSQNIKEFPFSPNLKTKEEKEKHLNGIDLRNQLEGLYNFLFRKKDKYIYLFRVFGIETTTEFTFKYEAVKLYNKNNKLFLNLLKEDNWKEQMHHSFFNEENNYIIATIKTNFQSPNKAQNYALDEIKKAIKFLDVKFGRTLRLDNRFYLYTTKNFRKFGFSKEPSNENIFLNEEDGQKLEENIFHFLEKTYSSAQEHILKYEHLWIEAINTKNIADYWHYIEAVLYITKEKGKDKEVKNIVASIALINENQYRKNQIINYLRDSISTSAINIPSEKWGLSPEEIIEVFNEMQKGRVSAKLECADYQFLRECKLNCVKDFSTHLGLVPSEFFSKL